MTRRSSLLCFSLLLQIMLTAQTLQWTMLRDNTLRALEATISRSSGIVGLAAVDLPSGETFGVNDTLVFSQGSAIKIPVLMEVFKQAREGRFRLSDRKPVPQRPYVLTVMANYLGDDDASGTIRDISRTLFGYFWRKGFATPFGTYADPAPKEHK